MTRGWGSGRTRAPWWSSFGFSRGGRSFPVEWVLLTYPLKWEKRWIYIMCKVYYFILLYLEVVVLPCCAIGWPLRPVGWGLSGVVVEELLWSLNCDWSVEWLELSWRSMAWERGRGWGRDEADARSRRRRKGRLWSRMVNRWKALNDFWWRRVPGRCWHCHPTGAGRSCGPSQRTDSLCWELERESKRRAESEGELKREKD